MLIESLLEQYKNSQRMQRSERSENLARILANRMAVRSGMVLNKMEMEKMIAELFYCKMPYVSPGGKPVLYSLTPDELDEKFLKHRF
jgi:DNA mismatch repair protein MutL